jgi:integrase
VVAVALRMGTFVSGILAPLGSVLRARVIDLGEDKALYSGFSPSSSGASYKEMFTFGGRLYRVETEPTAFYLKHHRRWQSGAVLVAGIVSTGLLGTLLLLSTGYARRIERVVDDRTRDLEATNRRLQLEVKERERAEAALHQAQRMEAIGRLTGGIAHDFNNLLTVVSGNAELLCDEAANDRVARRASAIRRAADQGERLTRQLLAFSRRQVLRREPVVERYLRPWLDIPLRSITREMVEDRHRRIKDETDRGDQPGTVKVTGEATANGAMRVLRLLYNFAADRAPELLPNPVRLRKQWYNVAPRERLAPADQLPAFWKAVDALENRTHRDWVAMALFTGLRRQELSALRWTEVDFANRVIRLPAGRTKAGRKLDLPMCSFVRSLLIARRALGNDGGWVFGADSRSGHVEEPREGFEKVASATGIRLSPHDMRRTYVTVAESSDISPLALKALVNHSLGKDITSGYVQMTVERLRGPAQRVCDRMMELCGVEAQPEGTVRVG